MIFPRRRFCGRESVCQVRAFYQGQKPLHALVVAADHVHSVKWNGVHEPDEGQVDGVLIVIKIHVVLVHVGHHGDDRGQAQE